MPFKSKAQARFMYSQHPEIAERWTAEMKSGKKKHPIKGLPQHVAKKDDKGTAATSTGAVLTGTGLLAGGIPGAKEPKSLNVWHLRGAEKGPTSPSLLKPSNLKHNLKIVAPLPRGGILGFRSDMHHQFIEETKHKQPSNAFDEGMQRGQLKSERKIVRGMRMGRRASYGVTAGGLSLMALGHHQKQQNVKKADRHETSTALASGGLTLGAVSHAADKGLSRFGRKYATSSKQHTKAAQALAPHLGGLRTTPARMNDFGVVTRPERESLKPEVHNWQISDYGKKPHETRADPSFMERIKPEDRERVGYHRATAAQERHFAEVFQNTARGFKRVRNPALAVGAAGTMGMWASGHHQQGAGKGTAQRVPANRGRTDRGNLQRGSKLVYKAEVAKSLNPLAQRSDRNDPVYYERTLSPIRAAGAGWGIGIGAYGLSRLESVNRGVTAMGRMGPDMRTLAQGLGHGIGVTQRLTEPAGARLRVIMERQPEGRYLLERLPKKLRMGLVTAGGAGLLAASIPVHRTTGRPVRQPR